MRPVTDRDAREAAAGLSPWILRHFCPPRQMQQDKPCRMHGGEWWWNDRCLTCLMVARTRMLVHVVQEFGERGFIEANPPRRFADSDHQGHLTHKAWEWVRLCTFVVREAGKGASGSRYRLAHDTEKRADESALFVNRLLEFMVDEDVEQD